MSAVQSRSRAWVLCAERPVRGDSLPLGLELRLELRDLQHATGVCHVSVDAADGERASHRRGRWSERSGQAKRTRSAAAIPAALASLAARWDDCVADEATEEAPSSSSKPKPRGNGQLWNVSLQTRCFQNSES